MEVDVESVDLCSATVRQFDELAAPFHRDVQRHLEVVLLLADERIVLSGEIEAFVRVHSEPDHRSAASTQKVSK